MEPKILLDIYMRGFNDELKSVNTFYKMEKAYSLGRIHALVGDDVRSVDYLSDDKILELIEK